MKNYNIILFAIILLSVSCSKDKEELTQGIKYPYDMSQYDGGILISNLGGDSLDYLSSAPTGFVSYYHKGKTKIIIPPNSGLYAPKGIDVSGRFLFVADVNRVSVFDLNDCKKIDEILFPQGDAFVNDVLVAGSTLFVSVTNYNKIYLLNISDPLHIDHGSLLEYIDIPYPSTMKMMGEYLFVASNSFDGTEYDDKIIHIIDDLSNPSVRPIIHEMGDYQGLEFSPNKTRLIFCNHDIKGYIGNIVFENNEYGYDQITDAPGALLNSLLLFDNKLYISDLANSKIYVREIIEFDNFLPIIKGE